MSLAPIRPQQTTAQLIAQLNASGFTASQTETVTYLTSLVLLLASALNEQGVELPEIFLTLLEDFDPEVASEPQGNAS